MLLIQVIPDYSLLHSDYPEEEAGEKFIVDSEDPEGVTRIIVDVTENGEKCAYMILYLFNDSYEPCELMSLAEGTESHLPYLLPVLFGSREYMGLGTDTWSGVVDSLYVFPGHRRKGIASFILNNLKDVLYKGTERISLGCLLLSPGNCNAVYEGEDDISSFSSEFLGKNGFRECDLPDFYIRSYERSLTVIK